METGFATGGRAQPKVWSVTDLNRAAAECLERGFPALWVAGEISNLTRAASGHCYFTLKDGSAQVRAVMFRGRAMLVGWPLRDGDRVEVRALVSLYQPRGEFQIQVEAMRRAGDGDLHQRFLALKVRLEAEGLFDPARKRPLPSLPRAIGVVTSAQGAALHDVLTTLARRAPHLPVIVYPTPVQGAEAPAALAAALACAARRAECDVLLLVRGGGSIEDLWAFNEESVARAIAAMPMPVVVGVGHETDFTIADFVADLRAPTPTGAATLVAVERRELAGAVAAVARRLVQQFERRQQVREQRLDVAARLLRSPSARWRERALGLHLLATRLAAAERRRWRDACTRSERAGARLLAPPVDVADRRLQELARRMWSATETCHGLMGQRLGHAATGLEALSPQAVLARGYAIVRSGPTIVRRAVDVDSGDLLSVRVAEGAFDVRVIDPVKGKPAGDVD